MGNAALGYLCCVHQCSPGVPEEPTYVPFPDNLNMPNDIISGFKGGDYAIHLRNLYGSKTALKLWYKCLLDCLTNLGFESGSGHPCLFNLVEVVHWKEITIIIAVFVDDLIVTGSDNCQVEYVKKRMEERFALTDESRLEYYLGVELEYTTAITLVLHQRAFVKKLLARFSMEDAIRNQLLWTSI